MQQENKSWGIDLSNCKMRYEPWTVDKYGKYRIPTKNEIKEIYGISGEAVNETLLYFEESNGDTQKLIKLLNDHIIDNRFLTDREKLLDRSRWYNNEYYFYFIMFTKKVIGDYNWHFSKGDNVQLSIYHKIYEYGFLKYVPYGGEEQDVNYSIVHAILKCYTPKGYDFSDYFEWIEALAKEKTMVSFKDTISKLENCLLCNEFNKYLLELSKVSLNKNSMITICYEAFDSYDLQSFSFVPEFMLLKVFSFITNKTGNVYEVEIKQTKKNSADFVFKAKDEYNRDKDHIYQTTNNFDENSITLGAFPQIIKKLFKLNKMPEVKNIKGQDTYCCSFTIEWEKRILSIPYLQLFLCNLLASLFIVLNHFYNWNIYSQIILFFIPVNIVLILLRLLKIEKMKRKISDENLFKSNEDNKLRLEEVQKLANELIMEKKELEQKVQERTKNLAEANEKLKELDVAKTNFFANVSHELRTPLTLIISPINEIRKGSYGKNIDKNNNIFLTMQKNTSRLLRLINNILDFIKIEENKMKIHKEKINISSALKIYISQIEPACKNKNLFIKFKDNTNGVITLIDQSLFETAIFNFLSNALKFTDKGGITIELEKADNDYFIIAITDTGIGIPEDKKEYIFERFHQIDEKSNRKYEGSGIGLILSKEIIELCNGKIEVESKLGYGSTFKIFLPIEKEAIIDNDKIEKIKKINPTIIEEFKTEKKESINEIKPIIKREKTILLVEDNIDLQKYISSMLESNYNIIIAKNGLDALEKIRNQNKPSLIISDIMMPEMDGREFYQKIQNNESYKDIPFIFLTARAGENEKISGLKSGAVDYICKPFNIDELVAKVENFISKNENIKDTYKNEIHKKVLNLLNEESSDTKFDEFAIEMKFREYNLSKREKEIIILLAEGKETKEIAGKLKINTHTVENHITNIYKKIGVSNKIELFRLLNK